MSGVEFKRFCELRTRLWCALKKVDMSDGCKGHEGALEIIEEYPNFFDENAEEHKPCYMWIKLHCYVLGPARHYDFFGDSWKKVFKQFEQWLKDNEEVTHD